MNVDKIAAALDDAADLIEQHGWTRGQMRAPDGSLCAMGALSYGLHGLDIDERRRACIVLMKTIGGEDDFPDVGLVGWNDADERTQQQVLDMFRAAAKVARGEQDERDDEQLSGAAKITTDVVDRLTAPSTAYVQKLADLYAERV